MVKLRLRRKGRIHHPVYDIIAVDGRTQAINIKLMLTESYIGSELALNQQIQLICF